MADELKLLRDYYKGRLQSPDVQAILNERFEDNLASHQADQAAQVMGPPVPLDPDGFPVLSTHVPDPTSRNPLLAEPPGPLLRFADGGVVADRLEKIAQRLARPMISKPSRLSEVRPDIFNQYGAEEARRLDRAADTTNLNMFSQQALRDAFTNPLHTNEFAGSWHNFLDRPMFTAMNPKDFEKYAYPLDPRPDYSWSMGASEPRSFGQYLNHLYGASLSGGFDNVPFLISGRPQTLGGMSLPEIEGHEGRHRMRSMANAGQQSVLTRVIPEDIDRDSWTRSLAPDRAVWPEGTTSFSPENPHAVGLPELFADGGSVDDGYDPFLSANPHPDFYRTKNAYGAAGDYVNDVISDTVMPEWDRFRRDQYNPLMYGMNAADRGVRSLVDNPQQIIDWLDPKLRDKYGGVGKLPATALDAMAIGTLGLGKGAAKIANTAAMAADPRLWNEVIGPAAKGLYDDTREYLGYAEGGVVPYQDDGINGAPDFIFNTPPPHGNGEPPAQVYAEGGLTKLLRSVAGKPSTIKIAGQDVAAHPLKEFEDISEAFAKRNGKSYPLESYPAFDEDRARRIADAYDAMKHDPTDPRVKHAYEALVDETMDQYRALKGTGVDFSFLKPGEADPYAATPSLGYMDLINNGRLRVFPTSQGYGTLADINDNPLLARVGRVGDLDNATANDAFRIVHDALGHFGPGNPFFRAKGEDRAFLNHARSYSNDALPAAASELRGQNSWVNFGPHGEANRAASGADTVYADQKTGLLPSWAWDDAEGHAEGGRIGELAKWIANKYGQTQGRRFEHAGDLTNLENYSTSGLKHVFDPQNAGLYTTMKPGDFERYAAELGPDYMQRSPYGRGRGKFDNYQDYIDYLAANAQNGGFSTVPMLGMNRPNEFNPLPSIDMHEGRHRMRALGEMGEDSGLVHLIPQNMGELRGGPDEAVDRLLEMYFPSGEGQLFKPQMQNTPRSPTPMTPAFKKGGSAVEEVLERLRTRKAQALQNEVKALNAGTGERGAFVSPDVDPKLQTVDDPRRVMYPLIYSDPRDLVNRARSAYAEDPGESGPMFQLFGHTRQSLDDLARSNKPFDIPRPDEGMWSAFRSPEGATGNAIAPQVMNARNANRIKDVLGLGLEDPDLRTTRSWYTMDPLYQHMRDNLGMTDRQMRDLNTRMGVMSPQASPAQEVERGFAAHYLANQGRLEDFVRYGAESDPANLPEDLQWLPGHKAHQTHYSNLWEYENLGGLWPSPQSNKVLSYVAASDPILPLYHMPVADSHFTRMTGLPDVRTAQSKAVLGANMRNPEYGALAPWWNSKIAEPLDEYPRDAQALAWGMFGPATGVRTIGKPKLEIMSDFMNDVAQRRGIAPEDARDLLLTGQIGHAHGGSVDDDYLGFMATNYAEGGKVDDDYLGWLVQNLH